ncbi:MAG: sulfatase-like hydrolase/transferase [Acidobacteria bacterium]|nr:sulfatase-like hydrolase/transferase [Acidobacteriota bacterium]
MPRLSRKQFLGASAAPFALQAAQLRTGKRPRNVLYLLSDQHRPAALGCAGNAIAQTPTLDGLARDGVRFTSAYCPYPVCTPSRASMLTGRYAHSTGVFNNATPWPLRIKTMAHHFGARGYATGLIGKMHFVDAQTHGFDYRLDFNDWFQYLGPKAKLYADELAKPNSGSGNPQIDALWKDFGDPWKAVRTPDSRAGLVHVGRASVLEERDHFESFVARESIRFLHNFGTKEPFFLISSYLKPHDPFMPPPEWAARFRAEDMPLPPTWGKLDATRVPKVIADSARAHAATPELRDPALARQRIAMYYANIAFLDHALAGVLAALRELNLHEETLVLYSSDHGEMLAEHGLWQKNQFYEPSCGVPLLFRAPGMIAPGGVCHTPVSQVGLAATLLDACGLPVPDGLDEPSFAHLLTNPGSPATRPVFAEYALGTPQARYMIRSGDWKYNLWVHDMPELYNLRDDPGESRNLALEPEHAATGARLREQLLAWHRPSELRA